MHVGTHVWALASESIGVTVDIPHWTETPDYFVWEAFDWASRDPERRLRRDALQQEALLADTENFYVIPDQFGVVDGHVLIIPKTRTPSIGKLDPAMDDEINWFTDHVATTIKEAYDSQVVVAEHGRHDYTTASQAHIHVVPIPRAITRNEFRTVVDEVLQHRMVGIRRITHRGADYTCLEDLRSFANADETAIEGRQLRCEDLVNGDRYPAAARAVSGRPYVYLNGPGVRFISTYDFRSQFAREVASRAAWQPKDSWDRHVYKDRTNMFDTFTRLAPAFMQSTDTKYGFRARGGALQTV